MVRSFLQILLTVSVCSAVLCVLGSLLPGTTDSVNLSIVSFTLLFAALHIVSSAAFLRRATSAAKWLLLLLVVPVLVFTIDGIGRLLALLGLPAFRILV
jgi:hypothetical protein